ncbi:T9SS type B sorting domain-containing protein [Tamlana sp. 2201CG12-4]|uniref:T9SS type B sorting domain-containing protein n=1 Tax=Tamlana sp. 2201CG12-4 TaxID=3112582 RepID=UPI002DBFCD8C|nr:T9SS type B sorting domain-containing protein [Tamlana sp. 2201CG12-4]MEC3906241.1 T9SS type B sorting domain-containing protein [Tamlana sp. 2201CG12-4]
MNNKTGFLLFSFCLLGLNSFSQNTSIPDINFEQALIDLGLDNPPINNQVPTSNIIGVTDLDIKSKSIQDLTGIEDFAALENLDCSDNLLTTINVTQLSNLKIFWCYGNQLTSLNVDQNLALTALRCENNELTTLNLLNNVNLVDLACENNQIPNLDVSENIALSRFQCGDNRLLNLDISNNPNLSYLSCEQNRLSALNVSNNNNLRVLLCNNNLIEELDLTQNISLANLDCSNNQLCRLNVKNGNNTNVTSLNFSNNSELNCVVVDNSNDNHNSWLPNSFSNYVESDDACGDFIPVDSLNDFIGMSYILPPLIHGNYFTQPNGSGTMLITGDSINTSQIIYVYNEVNCYSNESNFNVIITDSDYFIPKFFTPNNDGYNDTWKVLDNANVINNITIYNRYGKLIKFLPPNSSGWDGTYNKELLISDSYWYEIVLNTGEVLRGFFALKR